MSEKEINERRINEKGISGKEKIKILIADDQALLRDSLQIILSANEDMEVMTPVADGREVIRAVRGEKPDVILMDVRMPEMDGVSCTQIIKENYPSIKIIILTTFDDDEYVYNALKYGASGLLGAGAVVTGAVLLDRNSLQRKGDDQSGYCGQGCAPIFSDGTGRLRNPCRQPFCRGYFQDGVASDSAGRIRQIEQRDCGRTQSL